MIALCPEHHGKADVGTYTSEELHHYKANPNPVEWLEEKFEWRRKNVLVSMGGNFDYNSRIAFKINDTPVTWITRDEKNYLMLNINGKNIIVRDNTWLLPTNAQDIACLPSGKSLEATYTDGERFSIVFTEIENDQKMISKYPG